MFKYGKIEKGISSRESQKTRTSYKSFSVNLKWTHFYFFLLASFLLQVLLLILYTKYL